MATELLTRKELRSAFALLPPADTSTDDEISVSIRRDRSWYPRRPKNIPTENFDVRFLRVPFLALESGESVWDWVLDPEFELL